MIVYTSAAVFLFAAIALVVPSGFSLGAALLLLGALALGHPRARRVQPDRADWLVMGAFLVYFAINSAANLGHRAGGSEYDAPLRFLLAVPALLLVRAYPPRAWALWSGAATGAIGAGLLSLWQLLVQQIERPSGSTNAIQYGNISLVLALLCLCGMTWAVRQARPAAWLAWLATGAVMGVLASLLSGSRGSWIAAPVALLVVLYPLARGGQGRLAGKIVVGAGVVMALLWLLPQSGLRARTELAVTEAGQYQTANNADSSIGARLEMLRVGILMAPAHLLTGWGKQGMFDHKASLVEQGLAAPSISDHTHLHNEYLDALVKRGVPGLLAVLVLYLLPLAAFARAWRVGPPARQPYAVAGVVLLLSYLVFGLTQAFLTHNNGVMILGFMLAVLWGLMRQSQPAPELA